ncbi:hypothetical protein FNV43_RR14891 [Rhamnella rubrinervis]|uniref:Uncharacterized protein n=1 Tax=Rhamnella rubrinervis TaxID=2594499 RepID=A0A8K0H3R0_9ROSA|nr:hypothetical protein FNV43_RR14891 [Rhamnella rubrinervis]
MADLVLPPVLQVLFEKLASPLLRKLGNLWNLTDNFEKFQRTLVYVQSILEDAEEKQVTDRDVGTWLSELKRVVYDAEDLLDEITIIHSALMDSGEKASGMKLELLRIEYADRVIDMLHKLQMTRDEGSKFNLREGSLIHARIETSSFVIESEVFGREGDKDKVVELLLSSEATQGGRVSCIPIVGLGGIGKTTLAQLAYNDHRVKHHFNVKLWVFVSDHFDATAILMAVIESLTGDKCRYLSMDALHTTVQDLLHGKRYLIVLDDVWTENQEEWDKLRPLFRSGVDGSKIIITARSERVVRMTNSPTYPYHLEGLSQEACWSLFSQFAFQGGEVDKHPNLLPIGREIVKKCGGVALAAKALGSLMRLRREEREWLAVQNSELWNLGESECNILPALRLSYHHLPSRLKRCFSFCSIFPRRLEMKKEKLICQWMAAGLLQPSRERETPEDTGNDFFNTLLWMCFFQEVKQCDRGGGIIGYRMHDIVYDLAQFVAGTEFRIINHCFPPRHYEQIRHSSIVCDFRSSTIPEEFYGAKHLRTLFLFSEGGFREVPHKLFSSFRYLRELDMSGSGLVVLDGSIGDLCCLRYLDVSHTHIESLPRSIEKLCLLQTLNVSGCYNLRALPDLEKMSSLRHLNNTGCLSLTTMSPSSYLPSSSSYQRRRNQISRSIKRLSPDMSNQLQTLPLFVVGGVDDMDLLGRLNLRRSLKITHLGNVRGQNNRIRYARLQNMKDIESLGLYWGEDDNSLNINSEEASPFTRFQERKQIHSSAGLNRPHIDANMAANVLIKLHPHKNLKRLFIKGYQGHGFPAWKDLTNLTKIELIDCTYCTSLPILGNRPLLDSLLLQTLPCVTQLQQMHFPALRELILIDFPNLEKWSDDGDAFPILRKLTVSKCPKLTEMPQFPSIQHLELRDCTATLVHSMQNLTSLTTLVIEKVRDFSHFPGAFPVNNLLLTTLEIISCRLHSLPTFQNLTALKALTIRWCEELSYLPQGMHTLNALDSLEINDCHRLMFLPEIGSNGFCNLRTLSIENCRGLTSLSMGLKNLTSLKHLVIMYCPSLVTLPQSVQNLSALQSLTILGCCPEFTSLPEELQYLVGLHTLEIRSCPGLDALPEWIEKLISLRSLAISDCQHIVSLPKGIQRLAGLQHLSIQDCPQLLERCRMQNGEDWPKIAHVPYKRLGSPELRHPSEASSSSN